MMVLQQRDRGFFRACRRRGANCQLGNVVQSVTYDLVSVFSPESSEGFDIGSHADEVRASTTRNELGRNDL
jgi:hypothetical protein